jgi:hypothetical protein
LGGACSEFAARWKKRLQKTCVRVLCLWGYRVDEPNGSFCFWMNLVVLFKVMTTSIISIVLLKEKSEVTLLSFFVQTLGCAAGSAGLLIKHKKAREEKRAEQQRFVEEIRRSHSNVPAPPKEKNQSPDRKRFLVRVCVIAVTFLTVAVYALMIWTQNPGQTTTALVLTREILLHSAARVFALLFYLIAFGEDLTDVLVSFFKAESVYE